MITNTQDAIFNIDRKLWTNIHSSYQFATTLCLNEIKMAEVNAILGFFFSMDKTCNQVSREKPKKNW